MSILKNDKNLYAISESINIKNHFLFFQYEFIEKEEEKLAILIQSVIDKENIVKFIPKDLESFYHICFLLDKLDKSPVNINLWLTRIICNPHLKSKNN